MPRIAEKQGWELKPNLGKCAAFWDARLVVAGTKRE